MVHMHWTANVINDQEEKESFETYLQNNQRILKRLGEIIDEKQALMTRNENKLESYKDVDWSFIQAHLNGRRAALDEIKQLTI